MKSINKYLLTPAIFRALISKLGEICALSLKIYFRITDLETSYLPFQHTFF